MLQNLLKRKKHKIQKPKIAIIHPAYGVSDGGVQTFISELAPKLCKGLDVTILSAKKTFGEDKISYKSIFSIPRRSRLSKLSNILKPFCSSPDIVLEHITSFIPVIMNLLRNDYDVIYPCNDWGGLLAASVARKIKGTPIIFTEHCGLQDAGTISNRNKKFKPDKYIVLSPQMEGIYIPNGVDFSKFNPDIKPIKLNLQPPIVFACGRNYPNKRLDLVIEAVSRLDNVSLLIASPSENIKDLKKKGEKLLGNRFMLINVPYHEIAGYYRACDVFTLPSQNEPFGLVYLEALACNKPVVTTNDFTRKMIIGKGGILCNPENIDEYVNALNTALFKNWNNNPFNQAQKFSMDVCTEKYLNVINELIYNS